MNYGSVHSSGKSILPIGDSVSFRFMLDDYQKGNFWKRTIADHDAAAGPLYPDRRTYLQQLQAAIAENAQEIFICIDTPKNDWSYIDKFTSDILVHLRDLGFENEVIISPPNEPLEHMSVTEYICTAGWIKDGIDKSKNVTLSIGGMASEFTEFYRRIAVEIPYYDYIDFHTSNDGNIWSISWLINNMPAGKLLINSEHYLLNCAQYYGYNSAICLNHMKVITDSMFASPRIKSIYVTVPSLYRENPDDKDIVLRYVDKNNNIIMTTKMWYLLKTYEKEKEVMDTMKLEILVRGSTNWQVRVLQSCLVLNGFEPGPVDGIFGGGTEKALSAFNVSHSILADNVCSLATWFTFWVEINSRDLMSDFIEFLKLL